jgi:hypothetical protein
VVKTPPGSASIIQQALAGRPGSTGGAPQQPSDDDVEESGVDEANSGSTPPDPQDIPPPDLNAIDLATPKPTDIHQVAEEVGGGGGEDTTPGRRGFSAGLYYFDDDIQNYGFPVHDLDGETHIAFDANGNPIGGIVVVGLESAVDYEGETSDVKFRARVGDYPDSGTISVALGDDDIVTIPGAETTITGSAELDHEEWPETLIECECLNWGTWDAKLQFENEQMDLKGTWITGDFATADKYDGFATEAAFGTAYYAGTAVGYGQYFTGSGATDIFVATGEASVAWNFGTETGVFSLSNFGGGVGSPSDTLDHTFTGDAVIGRGTMEKGMFAGQTDGPSAQYLSVTGGFIDDGSASGAVIGSFGALEVLPDTTIFSGNGVFAADQNNY